MTVSGAGLASATASDPTNIVQVLPGFFAGETILIPGITSSDTTVYNLKFPNGNLFGNYSFENVDGAGAHIQHPDLGELIVWPFSAQGAALISDQTSGHVFLTGAWFPVMFDLTLGTYLYYIPDAQNPGHYTSKPRFFFDLLHGRTFAM